MGKAWITGAVFGLMAGQALAHPHVFVDTSLEVVFAPDGQAQALRVTWTYDALFTLSLLEDLGLDPGGDGALTEAETAAIQGFDMDWPPDFPGHLYAFAGGQPLALSGPEAFSARLVGDRVSSTHLRRLLTPLRPGDRGLIVKSYDPEHYYHYDITAAGLQAPGCAALVIPHDPVAADAALTAASEAYANATDLEAAFPLIGEYYADRVEVTCAPPTSRPSTPSE